MIFNKAKINSQTIKRLRATQMLSLRLEGNTIKDIAGKFNCSVDTVIRQLRWAEQNGLVDEATDKIIKDLVPLAHRALEQSLTSEMDMVKLKAAIEVFKGVGILRRPRPSEDEKNQLNDGGDSLEIYMRRRLNNAQQTPTTENGVIDGTVNDTEAAEETVGEIEWQNSLPKSFGGLGQSYLTEGLSDQREFEITDAEDNPED